jgi:hypothetical protein
MQDRLMTKSLNGEGEVSEKAIKKKSFDFRRPMTILSTGKKIVESSLFQMKKQKKFH